MYVFIRYYEDYKLNDILVYESPMDIPERLPSDYKLTTSNVIKSLAENNYCFIWEFKAKPCMQIFIYETEDTINDSVPVLYKRVNSEELAGILKKYE